MESGEPSQTAFRAARHRAAHQILDGGEILTDPLAVPILGVPERDLHDSGRGMRLFIAARSRFAEDSLAAAVRRGVRQAVVLGAGLDTFAYRHPHRDLRVVEVDHPDTQAWKRERLERAGIPVPSSVAYVGIDFESEALTDRLELDGPAFFLWLGVVPYLTRAGFDETVRFVASGEGNEVVFDYAQPLRRMSAAAQERAERAARVGEPWLTHFEPDEIAAELGGLGFWEIEDLGPAGLAARFFGRDDVPAETPGGHVLRALR